jgi:hypothetical protein
MKIVGVHHLLQFEQYVPLPIPFQTVRNLLLTGLNPRITHLGQLVRVSLALQNRPHDRHSRYSTDIADGVG